jgi:hypothetical protein
MQHETAEIYFILNSKVFEEILQKEYSQKT